MPFLVSVNVQFNKIIMVTVIYYVALSLVLPAWIYFIWSIHNSEAKHFRISMGIIILLFSVMILCMPFVEQLTVRDLINKLK